MQHRALASLVPLLTCAVAAAAVQVDPTLPAYAPAVEVSGELRVAGGDTMRPLVESWAREFHVVHPHATVRVDSHTSLSADGFVALLRRQVDLVTFVREPFPSEGTTFTQKFGFPPLLIPVAGGSYATKGGTHALAIFVNSRNPLTRLTLAQLDAVLSASRLRGAPQTIATWGQLGIGGRWGTRPVHVYGMVHRRESGNPPGIVNFIQQRVLLGGAFRDDIHEEVDRPGTSALAAIVQAVSADVDGIGYSGFGYATSNTKTIALAERSGAPFYAGRPEEVATGDYPLSRRVYLGVNRPPGQPIAPLVMEFISFALSRDGQELVAGSATGFLPLTGTQAAGARRQLE